jgi:hypothetical protein
MTTTAWQISHFLLNRFCFVVCFKKMLWDDKEITVWCFLSSYVSALFQGTILLKINSCCKKLTQNERMNFVHA